MMPLDKNSNVMSINEYLQFYPQLKSKAQIEN